MKKTWYILSAILFLALVITIITRQIRGNYYRLTPEEVHQTSVNNELLVGSVELDHYPGDVLIVHLTDSISETGSDGQEIQIHPDELLSFKNRKIFKHNKGLIVLQSDDPETSVRSWIILNRKGYGNIMVLDDSSTDILKYEFRPEQYSDTD